MTRRVSSWIWRWRWDTMWIDWWTNIRGAYRTIPPINNVWISGRSWLSVTIRWKMAGSVMSLLKGWISAWRKPCSHRHHRERRDDLVLYKHLSLYFGSIHLQTWRRLTLIVSKNLAPHLNFDRSYESFNLSLFCDNNNNNIMSDPRFCSREIFDSTKSHLHILSCCGVTLSAGRATATEGDPRARQKTSRLSIQWDRQLQ